VAASGKPLAVAERERDRSAAQALSRCTRASGVMSMLNSIPSTLASRDNVALDGLVLPPAVRSRLVHAQKVGEPDLRPAVIHPAPDHPHDHAVRQRGPLVLAPDLGSA
jgi:hypothetical protein